MSDFTRRTVLIGPVLALAGCHGVPGGGGPEYERRVVVERRDPPTGVDVVDGADVNITEVAPIDEAIAEARTDENHSHRILVNESTLSRLESTLDDYPVSAETAGEDWFIRRLYVRIGEHVYRITIRKVELS